MSTKKIMRGFSLVEAMLFLLIASLIVAATIPIVTKKHFRLPQMTTHGMYICYKDDETGKLHEARWSGKYVLKQVLQDKEVDSCTFIPPKKAPYFQVSAIGGGGGGGDSGYDGTARSENYSPTEQIDPLKLTVEKLKEFGVALSEYSNLKGKIYAFAWGSESGEAGAIGYTTKKIAKKCIGNRIFTPIIRPSFLTWKTGTLGTSTTDRCAYMRYETDASNCPEVRISSGSCTKCAQTEPYDCTEVKDYSWVCNLASSFETETYYIISCAGVQMESQNPVVGEQSLSCKTVSGPHTRTVRVWDTTHDVSCSKVDDGSHLDCKYRCKPGATVTYPCDADCPDASECKPGNITFKWLEPVELETGVVPNASQQQQIEERCGYKINFTDPLSDGNASACAEADSTYLCYYWNTPAINPNNEKKNYPTVKYEDCDSDSPTCDEQGSVDVNKFTYTNASYWLTYGGGPGFPQLCVSSPKDLDLNFSVEAETNMYEASESSGGCTIKGASVDLEKVTDSDGNTLPFLREVSSGHGLARCVNGCAKECTGEDGDNPPTSSWVTFNGTKVVQSFGSPKGGAPRVRKVRYVDGVAVEDIAPPSSGSEKAANGSDGYCSSHITGQQSYRYGHSVTNPEEKCSTTARAGYCLIHHNGTFGGDLGEANGKYRWQYAADSDYLTYGAPGEPGELKTTIIRTLKGVDTSIVIGDGGAPATSGTGNSGSPGGNTLFGIGGELITANGGAGGVSGLDSGLDPLLPVYDATDLTANPNKYKKEVYGKAEAKVKATGLATKIMNLVIAKDAELTDAENIFMSKGMGGDGGGVTHNCWAGQRIFIFEGVRLTTYSVFPSKAEADKYGGTNYVPDGCETNYSLIAAKKGKPGALLIKW